MKKEKTAAASTAVLMALAFAARAQTSAPSQTAINEACGIGLCLTNGVGPTKDAALVQRFLNIPQAQSLLESELPLQRKAEELNTMKGITPDSPYQAQAALYSRYQSDASLLNRRQSEYDAAAAKYGAGSPQAQAAQGNLSAAHVNINHTTSSPGWAAVQAWLPTYNAALAQGKQVGAQLGAIRAQIMHLLNTSGVGAALKQFNKQANQQQLAQAQLLMQKQQQQYQRRSGVAEGKAVVQPHLQPMNFQMASFKSSSFAGSRVRTAASTAVKSSGSSRPAGRSRSGASR